LFFNLSEVTTVAALSVLIIQALVHYGHIKLTDKTGAKKWLIITAFVLMTFVVIATLYYNAKEDIKIIYYLIAADVISFILEYTLRKFFNRTVKKHVKGIYYEIL